MKASSPRLWLQLQAGHRMITRIWVAGITSPFWRRSLAPVSRHYERAVSWREAHHPCWVGDPYLFVTGSCSPPGLIGSACDISFTLLTAMGCFRTAPGSSTLINARQRATPKILRPNWQKPASSSVPAWSLSATAGWRGLCPAAISLPSCTNRGAKALRYVVATPVSCGPTDKPGCPNRNSADKVIRVGWPASANSVAR